MKLKMWQKVAIGMILGILLGHFYKDTGIVLKPIAIIFINMIKMVVVPLVFFSILNGVASMTDAAAFTRIGSKAFMAYTCTTIVAVIIGLSFGTVFEPGKGINIELSQYSQSSQQSTKGVMEFILDIIPTNPIQAMATGNIMQVVVFAFFTGFALILIGEKGNELKKLIVSTTHLVFKMIELVISLTPYGVFAMMAWVVSTHGLVIILTLGKLIVVLMGGFGLQYLLFGVMLMVFARLKPFPFYKKMIHTQMLALATVSSKATLPIAMQELETKVGVSKRSASFVMPLGAAVNMDGSAIYLGICSVFFAQVVGVDLTLAQYCILLFTCTFGSIGAAGFPGGGVVMLSMVLASVGLPIEGISLVLGIDRFVDMFRTTLNVTGDCAVTVIADRLEGTFNESIYYSK
ncbi:dicarboxylate/amino acid:cation symporter [Rickettsiales endosymbiont of Peranema trichophorum]|uniref:dicarboxylate/amino acid:cation symporter n=1 Tax=Rickettsiales endosymbiont of Peranema trichophorum TaxID=2486577 RepID=UPI0010237BA6|nr:dicarboxylate/amino acid:cation symporter [Rickettsiales endosymbiont of Peranema trichophorum]RZI47682.1 dicarboxylate/amino acid:cation symporter [Rickettsiales endosymbiont of Peranema trichophorum]